jgi:SAM-dependent methyltransferase
MEFRNVYEDGMRAQSYANLEFPGTYYLAFRDLPAIIHDYSKGGTALDFGCGTGCSTRFLRGLGFHPVGVDISREMIAHALERDPAGDYRHIQERDLHSLTPHLFDLILSPFTFDNISTMEKKVEIFHSFKSLLKDSGCIIHLVSSPEIYTHEWTSFSTRNFPQNRNSKSGERVWIVMLDVEDQRPVEDIFWTDEDYAEVFQRSGFKTIRKHRPLGDPSEPFQWVSETTISPWVIYVLQAIT